MNFLIGRRINAVRSHHKEWKAIRGLDPGLGRAIATQAVPASPLNLLELTRPLTLHYPSEHAKSPLSITLNLALPSSKLHDFTESDLEAHNLPPPFWAFLWPGGNALTHYVSRFKWNGRKLLDLGSGCGVSSIACAMLGAERVWANDVDPFAAHVLKLNVEDTSRNNPDFRWDTIVPLLDDLLSQPERVPPVDTILVGDLFYDAEIASMTLNFLDTMKSKGVKEIYIGDPGRWAFKSLERSRLHERARYAFSSLPGADSLHRENDGFDSVAVYEFV